MEVYVVQENYRICGIYDSLLAVKQDFLTEEEVWEDVREMSEKDYTELLYQYELYLSKKELYSFDYSCSHTPIIKKSSETTIQML